ncbi:MAG TPA: histidine kinase dimerization/phospho-acceptor domain-containing protein, partial [Chitinophagales bacterium]|nr:histidine kinase dimerization/phospho-acceptor domain-containing protein [Chitinophagales bacterium]
MKIKTKLSLGLLFLFIVLMLITAISIYSINRLASDSKAILKANYESLEFSGDMLEALDLFEAADTSWHHQFETSLHSQEKNVTEAGEEELTTSLRRQYEQLKNDSSTSARINSMRSFIYRITDLNLNAIVRKNAEAQKTADNAKMYLALIGSFCFLITLSFIINFPGYIANPIKELTEGIQQIANKNYSQRLHFRSEDEFGQLAAAFNSMASKLDQYENSNLAKIIFEKKRIETIINNMHDAIIGFNEKNVILFANEQAVTLLGMHEEDMIGKYAPDVALRNDLLRTLINPESGIKPLKIFAEGKESYFTKELYPIKSGTTAIGQVILLKNITSFRELDIAKTNFIATISHELKTPISSIKMSLKLLEDERVGVISSEQKLLVENIKEDTNRLLKITGELLDLA